MVGVIGINRWLLTQSDELRAGQVALGESLDPQVRGGFSGKGGNLGMCLETLESQALIGSSSECVAWLGQQEMEWVVRMGSQVPRWGGVRT